MKIYIGSCVNLAVDSRGSAKENWALRPSWSTGRGWPEARSVPGPESAGADGVSAPPEMVLSLAEWVEARLGP